MKTTLQTPLFPLDESADEVSTPKVNVRTTLSDHEWGLVRQAELEDIAPVEAWTIKATNRQLHYSSHGIFRFFGKFPPPIAAHLIERYSSQGDLVIDPMVGSGTSAVEALLANRQAYVSDVSPLSVLLTRVKTTHVDPQEALKCLGNIRELYLAPEWTAEEPDLVGLRNPDHWFNPETKQNLARLKKAIDDSTSDHIRDLFWVAFAWTVRRVSRATTQQGRLFLDVNTAIENPWKEFESRLNRAINIASSVPKNWVNYVKIKNGSAVDMGKGNDSENALAKLCILHPPYFNNYKYSGINSLELAWLGFNHNLVRKEEIREFFKVGMESNTVHYINDMSKVFENIATRVEKGGHLGLMVGDSIFRNEYLAITRKLVNNAKTYGLRPKLVALRVPQFTEASWVASQRRKADKVGVSLYDFVIIFEKD